MNKVFKVVWSKAKNCYVVVSEIAKNQKGKKRSIVVALLATLVMTSNVGAVTIKDGGQSSFAIGKDASVASGNAMAIGVKAESKSAKSIAIGSDAVADGQNDNGDQPHAIAIGGFANATGQNSMSLGYKSVSSGLETIALGGSANASGVSTIALGTRTAASGNGAMALGTDAVANQDGSMAIGTYSKAQGIMSIAIGSSQTDASGNADSAAQASGAGSVSVGSKSRTTGDYASAFGLEANAADGATALGYKTVAGGNQSTAVGSNASSGGSGSFAAGYMSSTTNERAVALGYRAQTSGERGVSVGNYATATGTRGIAIGSATNDIEGASTDATTANGPQAKGTDSIAVGTNAQASSAGSLALGKSSLVSNSNGVAIGTSSSSSGVQAMAIGAQSVSSGENAFAIGTQANASGARAMALGVQTVASGTKAIAIGSNGTTANAENSIAIGLNSKATNTDTVALGKEVTASGSNATVIGKESKALSDYSIVMGSWANAAATATNSVVIGRSASTTQASSVVLGSNSTDRAATAETQATVGDLVFKTFAGVGSTNKGVVSIGKAGSERQLINVAAGNISSSSTDAVNGSQLYATNNMINTVANSVKAVIGTPATLSNTGTFTITNLGGTGKTTIDEAIKASITEMKAGTNVTVSNTAGANGQKIYTVNGEKTTLTAGSTDISVTPSTKDSNNVTNYTVDLSTTTKNTIAQHTADIAANKDKIATNTADIATNKADIATNKDKIATNTADIATNKADIATNKAAIAVNKTAIDANTTAITNLGNNTFTLTGDSTSSTTAQALNKTGGLSFKVAGDGKYISTAASGDTVTVSLNEQAIKDTAKFKVKANSEAAADVSGGDTVSFNDGSNIEIKQNGTDFTIATKKDVTFDSVKANTFTAGTNVLNATGLTVGDTTVTTAGLTNGTTTITGTGVTTDAVTAGSVTATGAVTAGSATIGNTVTINNAGINAGNTVITNVASGGTLDSNAANIGDVKQAVANLSQNLTISDGTTDGTVDLKNQKLTVTGTGAATATVSGQSITVNVAEGTLTPNTADGTVTGSTTGVAKAADVAAAINNTNAVLTNKLDANTAKVNDNTTAIATNKADITANKDKIAANTAAIATNKADIAANKTAIADNATAITNLGNNTFTLIGDGTSSTTAQALNKTGGLSFKLAGDGKYISTAAAGDTVTVSLNEQAIKDTAKFKVKANSESATDVSGGDTVSFNDGSNIEIKQNGTDFTIATKKDVTFDSVKANTFTAGTNVLNATGLTVGDTTITTAGLTNGTTTITGTGVTTDAVTAGSATIGNTVSINNAGINAGNTVITNVASGGTTDTNAANIGDVKQAVANLSQNLTISDGTTDGTVDLKNQKLTVTGTGAATATVSGQNITVNVAEGTLTPNTADGTVAGSATGVAKAADVATAINNTNTVLTGKIDVNTAKINDNAAAIATNKADIAANKTAIADNAKAITNLGNNIFTLNGDSTSSTTAQALNKNGGLSFKVAGDGKYISTAASGDTVKVSLNEQAIKDTAKFKVKANSEAATDVSGGDTVSFNDGSNIEIKQNGTEFTIATKKDVTFDSVKANTFTAGTNVLNATGLTVGDTTVTTAGLSNGTTTITGTGVTTDAVTAGSTTIGGKVSINNAGINAGNTVITNVASGGTTDTNAANIGDVKQAVANLSQNLTISDGTTDGTVDLKNQKLTVTGTGAATATVSGQSITVNVAEGTLTPNTADGTVAGSATGVAKAADVATAVNNTNTVLTGKIDANTAKINDNAAAIATNKGDIAANKDKIATNTADIATNKADIAANKTAIADNATAITNLGNNTFTLNGDSTSTTSQALNKNGGLSFKVAGDGKYISTAATGDTVTVSLDEQAIKDTAKFKVKANGNTATDVSGGDTVSFNDGSNIEIKQSGTEFTIATKKDVTFDSVTTGSATIGGKVTINNAGINAGNTVITNVASGGNTDSNAANIGDVKQAVANLSQNLNITDGTNNGTVDLKNQKLTVTGTGAATATVNGQSITVNVAEGTLTPNTADGTVAGSATGVAKAADVAAAINNTNTVLTDKIDANTTKINTNTANIDANKANIAKNTADIGANTAKINDNATAIAKNATDIATNKADIAANKTAIANNTTAITNLGNNTLTLNGDSTSTTAQTLNKNGGLSFKVAGDGKYISTAAAGDTVTVSLDEQAIKDAAKSSVKFKVKANANAEEVVNADDTIAFNDGNNIEITQNGKEFTIATKKDVTFDSVTANTFTAGTNVLNGTGLTVGNTAITTAGLINGNTTITGTGVTTDTVTAGTVNAGSVTADAATIGGKVSINNAGINAGNTVITNVAAGSADTDAVNVGQLKQQIKEATDTKNIRINYKANGGASESVSLSDGLDFKNGHLTTTEVGPNGAVKVNVVEGKIDITNGTATASQSGVATVSDVADAINHVQTSVSNGRINFSGDNKGAADPSTTLSRGFNQALEFVGGADVANLSDRNIGVNVVGNKMEIKLAKDLTGLTSSTFTDGTGNTTVVNGAGISIQGPTGNSQASAPVTLTATGLDNGGNRIANVADGVASTDVATVGQLRNMGSNTAMAITNLQRESQRIGAQSAAMAALKPIQYDPLEPTQIMAGIGNYRGETAGALGIAHYTNENTMFHIGATIGNDNNMVNAGVTHKFGSSAEKEAIPERYKAGPISSMYVMQTEMSQLQKENTEQKEVIAAQQHRLSTMETENAQQKQQLDAQQKSIDELKAAVAALLARG